jgi:hypothetical protein
VLDGLDDLPLVPEQRDCAPWNVLLDGDRVSVADWESSEPEGLPGVDLVYFLANVAFVVGGVHDRGVPAAPVYAAALDPSTALGASLASCLDAYCSRVGLDPERVPALRLLCWTIHALSEHRRLELDVLGPPAPELLERTLFLTLWRADLARATA